VEPPSSTIFLRTGPFSLSVLCYSIIDSNTFLLLIHFIHYLYRMHPVVFHTIALIIVVYTTVISTHKIKSIPTCQRSFIGQRCFATFFTTFTSSSSGEFTRIQSQFLNCVFFARLNMDPYYYNLFHFYREYYISVK
jgi:hypothetical protein